MPRDYSRNKNGRSAERRDYRRNSSTSASGLTWMLIGILVGLCIAGVAYLNQSKNHNEVEANANSQRQVAVNQSATPAPAKKTNNPQFDFYNMLPANQVSAPTATDQNTAQTTNDNIARPSAPPNPAKVNAILSGVTPPTATANANNLNVNANTNNNTSPNNNSHQNVVSANSVDDNGDIISVPKNTSNGNATSAIQAKNKNIQPNTSSAYIIQLAAFLHYQQADQFKAQLAFSGYEAKIIPFQKNGKTLQRVWIGPYPSLVAAAAVQRQLATNQIRSTLLKVNSQ